VDIVTNQAFDGLLSEAQWRILKRGVPINNRTQLIELGVAVLAALERCYESYGYRAFLPQDVIDRIECNWASIRGSELGYNTTASYMNISGNADFSPGGSVIKT